MMLRAWCALMCLCCASAAAEAGLQLGACCVGTTCLNGTIGDCAELGGVFHGVGSTCSASLCGACPGQGSCCSVNFTPGCNNTACCDTVCDVDPFCCSQQWDLGCATAADDLCDICQPLGACCLAFGTECEQMTQTQCNEADGVFQGNGTPCSAGTCEPVCPGDGPCCQPHEGPGCEHAGCCQTVCDVDSFCCEEQWDDICAGKAENLCGICDCGQPNSGPCCSINETPGCNDAACCATICDDDPFCCDDWWDNICADAATAVCGICDTVGACCVNDGGCFETDTTTCAIHEGVHSGPGTTCGGPGECIITFCGENDSGDCCEPDDTPGCNDAACCEAVCTSDLFCCTIEWDGLCAEAAAAACDSCADGCEAAACEGDFTDDFLVNVNDLLELLGKWGSTGGDTLCEDLDTSGEVDVADLLILLGHWGPCPG